MTEVTVAAGFFIICGLKRAVRVENLHDYGFELFFKLRTALAGEIGKNIIAYFVIDVLLGGFG